MHDLGCGRERSAGIDGQAARIAVGIEVAVDRVGQPLALADVLEESRAHASAEKCIENVSRVALLVCDRMRGYAQAQLHLFERFLIAKRDAGNNLRSRRMEAIAHRLHMLKLLSRQFNEAVVIEIAGSRDDDITRGEAVSIGI